MKYILPIILLVFSLLIGFYIQIFSKDLSKNTGFLFSSVKTIMPLLHILAGIVCGFLIYPNKYDGSWENSEKNTKPNWKTWTRQSLGLFIFLVFTIRSGIKHTKNLQKHMEDCNMNELYNPLLSSSTRQQAQFMIGISISFIINDSYQTSNFKIDNKTSIIFNGIVGITILQYIIQFLYTYSTNYVEIKDRYISCVRG